MSYGMKFNRAGGMGAKARDFFKKPANIMLIVVIGILGVVAIVGWASLTTPPPEEAGPFDVKAWDGARGIELPADSFDWELFGIEGTDITDFGEFDSLATGSSLANIDENDLDEDYDTFVVKASGTVVMADWDADDPMVEDIDETYDHYYYERWFVLSMTGVNWLIFYENASSANFVVVDSSTVLPITTSEMPIAAQTNFTVFAMTNASQPFARFVTGPNYENEANDIPEFVVNFDAAVGLKDLNCQGATKSRYNDTAIKFTFGVLSSSPAMFQFIWGDDATQNIQGIHLMFGELDLASLT